MKYPVKDCVINDYYTDAKEPVKARQRYCEKMCNFLCKKNLPYKKIGDKNG